MKQKGYSLIEIVVVLAVGALITAGISSIMVTSVKTLNNTQSATNTIYLAQEIALDANSTANCTANFSPVGGVLDPVAAATAAGQPANYTLDKHSLGTISAGSSLPTFYINVTALNIVNAVLVRTDPITGNNEYAINLELQTEPLNPSNNLVPRKPYRSASFSIIVDPTNNFLNCTPSSTDPVVICSNKGMYYLPGGFNSFASDADGCIAIAAFTGSPGAQGPAGPPGAPGPRGAPGSPGVLRPPPPKSDQKVKSHIKVFTESLQGF